MTVCDHSPFVILCHSFPVLGGSNPAPGVTFTGIDLDLLDRWASNDPEAFTAQRGPFPGDAAKDAARFVLAVFSTQHKWKCGPFDLFRAMQTWDAYQRSAFLMWAANPVRP